MDELTRILWDYACRCRLEGCYSLEMKTMREEEEKMTGRNREHMEKAGCPAKDLENLWYSLEVIRTVDMEAAFTCGLRLGLALK